MPERRLLKNFEEKFQHASLQPIFLDLSYLRLIRRLSVNEKKALIRQIASDIKSPGTPRFQAVFRSYALKKEAALTGSLLSV